MWTRPTENAVVIGGGSGMGRAAAQALCARGVRLFLADQDLKSAQDAAMSISETGTGAVAFRVDVASSGSVVSLFEAVKGHTPSLDLMVHTAAILGRTASIQEVTDEEWRRMMAVNLDGPFFCCREAVRWMKETGGGRIILFSSVASLTPTPGALPYSTAKAGVNMLAKTLAAEVARYNIRVNVIAPGYVTTPMLRGLPEGFDTYIVKRTPLQRMGEVEEMAALVAFLASPEADFFTGQVLSPNGGLVI